jgi:hypothetical protein
MRAARYAGEHAGFAKSVKARRSCGGDHWLPDDYDVRDSHGKVVGPHHASPASTEKTSRGSGR